MNASGLHTTWMICQACGHWQRAQVDAACSVCQWPRLARGAVSTGAAELRVLVDVELRSDRTWHITGITTPRVDAAINHAFILRRLNEDGLRLFPGESEASRNPFPALRSWDSLRNFARQVLTEELNSLIRRSWEGLRQPSPLQVFVSVRALLLDPDVAPVEEETALDWLEVVPCDAAVASAAATLREGDVTFDVSRTRVSLAPRGNRVEIAVRAPCEILIEECTIVSEGNQLLVVPLTRFVKRDTLTALPPIILPVEVVRAFAENGLLGGRLLFSVRGNKKKLGTSLPIAELPAFNSVADIFLDLGSTNTKWVLRLEGGALVEHDQDTDTLVEVWGIDAYRKAEFVSDPTGDRWSEWVARALPALRHWVGRDYNAYLRNVHLSLPSSKHLDVGALAKAMGDGTRSAGCAPVPPLELLKKQVVENLAAEGEVVLAPENELIAAHYLGVLQTLQKAAEAYAARFKSHEDLLADQMERQRGWDADQAAVNKYESRWFVYRLFNDRPAGPSGSRPTVDNKITNPADWMDDLVEYPEQFDQVVLLDAGGLSLDISVLENHRPLLEFSHSDTTCGGEAVSSRIGRRETGHRGTRYKAQLGLRWQSTGETADSAQREYRDATRELYGPVLTRVFRSLGATRWNKSARCCVLLTGGGSRNPHLAEYVGELASSAGLQTNVVDAPLLQDLIRQAREFPEPLHELDSEEVQRFEVAQAWSERRERQPFARYDKFAVVGGMLALTSGRK